MRDFRCLMLSRCSRAYRSCKVSSLCVGITPPLALCETSRLPVLDLLLKTLVQQGDRDDGADLEELASRPPVAVRLSSSAHVEAAIALCEAALDQATSLTAPSSWDNECE